MVELCYNSVLCQRQFVYFNIIINEFSSKYFVNYVIFINAT